MRVLLDSNVLVSYLLPTVENGPIRHIVSAAFVGAYTLLLPTELIEELSRRVRTKPYLSSRITATDLSSLITVLRDVAEEIPAIMGKVPSVVRDKKDDYIIAAAIRAHADYVVTGDKDLLMLREVNGVRMVTPAAFAAVLGLVRP